MNYIDKDTLREIKEIDLLTYFKLYNPYELVHVSHETYSTRTHDSVIISNGLWNQFSSGVGGKSALDYLIKVDGKSFIEAANILLEKVSYINTSPEIKTIRKKQKKKSLLLPTPHKEHNNAIEYLTNRGIDKDIVHDFIKDRLIYETHFQSKSGYVFKNIVFLGKDYSGETTYASIRGIYTEYKGDATGSDKHYSFRSLSKNENKDEVHVFESAIDLLSCATLINMKRKDYRSYNLISLAGIYQPKKNISESKMPAALNKYLKKNNTNRIVLHLDNDKAGILATKAITTVLPDKYEVLDCPPKHGKDYNDYIQVFIGKNISRGNITSR